MKKLLTIAANTFTETLRQPVYAVIIVAALLLFILAPALTMYSLDDDNKFLREISLSTLFLASLFISIFAASGAVAEEIGNKTITTVVTKPVQRPIFLLAKFLGVALAVALAHYLCTIAYLMAIRHGVMETVNDTHDWSVISIAAGVLLLTFLFTAFFNYFYDWQFSSTAIVLGAVFASVGIVFLAFFDRNWKFDPAGDGINLMDIYASILLFMGALVFWVSDAIYEGSAIPARYIFISGLYALCYTTGILSIAVALFQRRQVG
jgi:ABC-2 type transport system permease protein